MISVPEIPPKAAVGPRTSTRLYQICSRCVMDTSDPDITFDETGLCSHCHNYDRLAREGVLVGERGRVELARLVGEVKQAGAGKRYDCVIGVSGGVDSTYVAWKVKELGLRPLAVHLDNGWDSEIAVSNILTVLKKVGIDLQTEVLDWEQFKNIQVAFLRASVPDAEVPSDHAIFACLYNTATKIGVRYVITGLNIRTETHLPKGWSQGHIDWGYLMAVHQRYGSGRRIRNFPHYSFFQFIRQFRDSHVTINILDYVDYSKKHALVFLQNELGWRDYGGKHYESVYTRWYQGVYLPRKFGFDKRRSHLSSRLCSGEVTRSEALAELQQKSYPLAQQQADCEYVAKKLALSPEEFNKILTAQTRRFDDFPSYQKRLNSRQFQIALRMYQFIKHNALHPAKKSQEKMIHRLGIRTCKARIDRGLRHWRRKQYAVTVQEIIASLDKLNISHTRAVLVHSSLSACGYLEGGASVMIKTLRDWCGSATLAMPSHSYCYPDKDGAVPIFDPERTASVVGTVTDAFWRQPEVKRSLHPTHSLACVGGDADELIARHQDCDTPCGRGTPYARLVTWDATILMFGVTLEVYTLFHTAEDAACVPYLYEPHIYQLKVRERGCMTRDFQMRRQDMRVIRRFKEMDHWLEARGLLKRQRCGSGELLLLPHGGAVHEAVTQALSDDPWLLVAPKARPHNA